MSKEKMEEYFLTLLPISKEKAKQFAENFECRALAKNELLLVENKVSRHTYFLEDGYIRSYLIDNNGEEVTTNIYSAPCFVNDFISFFKQQPSKENFQALTPSIIWATSFEEIQKNFHAVPEFREFGRLLLINNYSLLHDRMVGMIKDTAEQRYLKLLEKHSDIFQNVPLKIIASYLGITDSSLSRIRKEIMHK
jgi:CRP-like cAMP-binding protein